MRHGLDHPVVNDLDFTVWQSYAIKAWPTIVVIDPGGKLIHTQSGEILAADLAPQLQAVMVEFESQGLLDHTPLELQPERMQQPQRVLDYPAKLLLTGQNVLYLSDTGHHRILEVQLNEAGLTGEIRRVFGSGQPGLKDGSLNQANFHAPHGLARQESTLYVADTENHAIRAIDLASGAVRTVAGTGEKAHGRLAFGPPTQTPLRSPWALLTIDDIVFIAMAGSHQIWALWQEAQLGPFFGNGYEALVDGDQMQSSFNQPSDLAFGLGHMFVADAEASAIRAIRFSEKPEVLTLIGAGLFEFGDLDGFGSRVRLQHPTGLTFYEDLVYIADTYNHKIKTLDPTTGQVKTLIGVGRPGQRDGGFAQAELFEPEGLMALDGRLYIADTNNHLIRMANLAEQTLHTLRLTGLDRLIPAKPAPAQATRRLDPLIVAPGEVEVSFMIELPEGYKLNPEAPQMLSVHGAAQYFAAGEPLRFTLNTAKDDEVALNLTLYYCQSGDERLCFIHDTGLILPLVVKSGEENKVQARYTVPI